MGLNLKPFGPASPLFAFAAYSRCSPDPRSSASQIRFGEITVRGVHRLDPRPVHRDQLPRARRHLTAAAGLHDRHRQDSSAAGAATAEGCGRTVRRGSGRLRSTGCSGARPARQRRVPMSARFPFRTAIFGATGSEGPPSFSGPTALTPCHNRRCWVGKRVEFPPMPRNENTARIHEALDYEVLQATTMALCLLAGIAVTRQPHRMRGGHAAGIRLARADQCGTLGQVHYAALVPARGLDGIGYEPLVRLPRSGGCAHARPRLRRRTAGILAQVQLQRLLVLADCSPRQDDASQLEAAAAADLGPNA